MRIVRSPLVKVGREEDRWFFAKVHAAFKITRMPYEYLGEEAPYEHLTWKHDSLRVWGGECSVHQNQL